MSRPPAEVERLVTEASRELSVDLDLLSTRELVALMRTVNPSIAA